MAFRLQDFDGDGVIGWDDMREYIRRITGSTVKIASESTFDPKPVDKSNATTAIDSSKSAKIKVEGSTSVLSAADIDRIVEQIFAEAVEEGRNGIIFSDFIGIVASTEFQTKLRIPL